MAIKNLHAGEVISNDERGLTLYDHPETYGGMLMPLANASQAAAAIDAYETLKTAIVRPDDIQVIQGRNFLKKSFWRRIAACFGLSLEMVGEERLLLDGKLAYRATYRAIAPNGRTMDGDGMCMQGEKGQMIEHNIRAIAHTRAKNRAISDIVGGGEVSAEEMQDEDAPAPRQNAPQRPAAQTPAPASTPPWKALTDADVLDALNHLDVRGRSATTAYLGAIREEMQAAGLVWTRDQVLAQLLDQLRQRTREMGEADTSENDLADLDTGAPGN